jgi:succinyl-CoA synthetase beta subunit
VCDSGTQKFLQLPLDSQQEDFLPFFCIMRTVLSSTIRARGSLLRGSSGTQTRLLNIHEYASMEVMRSYGIPVPASGAADSVDGVSKVYKDVIGEGNDCVIKAMVLTGGRGLGKFSNGFKVRLHPFHIQL